MTAMSCKAPPLAPPSGPGEARVVTDRRSMPAKAKNDPNSNKRGQITVGQQVRKCPDRQRRQHWVTDGRADARRHIGGNQQDHGGDHQQQHHVLDPRRRRPQLGIAASEPLHLAVTEDDQHEAGKRHDREEAAVGPGAHALDQPCAQRGPHRHEVHDEKKRKAADQHCHAGRSPHSLDRRPSVPTRGPVVTWRTAIICATFGRSIPTMGLGDA
jgi:hypothetical protein